MNNASLYLRISPAAFAMKLIGKRMIRSYRVVACTFQLVLHTVIGCDFGRGQASTLFMKRVYIASLNMKTTWLDG